MMTYQGMELVTGLDILNFDVRGCQWTASRLGCFNPVETISGYPLNRGWGDSQGGYVSRGWRISLCRESSTFLHDNQTRSLFSIL